MNKIYIGKISIDLPEGGFLFIHDDVPTIPRARIFDPNEHSFNPLANLTYRKASDVVDIFDALFPRGDSTLTKDTGLDFIADSLDELPKSLETLIETPDKKASSGHVWAYGKMRRLTRSPVLKRVLCAPTNFSLNPRSVILARVNRAELGEFDALALGLFLMASYKGQVIVPDFGFYARGLHVSLIREQRLICGVNYLHELPPTIRQLVLLMSDTEAHGCTWEDANTLAQYRGLTPSTVAHADFIERCMAERGQ